MSTEQLNNDPSPGLDPQTEEAILSFVELNNDTKSKPSASKPPRIRKRTRNLIITSVCSVLLAGVLLIVMLGGQQQPQTNDSGETNPTDQVVETPKITLLDKSEGSDKATQLQQVDIQNADDSFSILYNKTAHAYRLKGYEDISLATDMIVTLRNYTETIEATEQVKDATDLSIYGLEKPNASAAITYADGTTAKLYIGNQTPSKTGYYGHLDGSEDVYIFDADAVALFRFRSTAFVDTTLVTAPSVKSDDEYGKALLKEITYSGKSYPTPLVIRRSYDTDSEELTYFSYIITSPYIRSTADSVSTALGSLQSVSAEQALILHPTAEQKKKTGFDDPLFELNVTMAVETEENSDTEDDEDKPTIYYNTVNYHITVGSQNDEGDYVVMIDGIDAIFLVSKESYSYLMERTYANTVNEALFYKNITQLSHITIQLEDASYDFVLEHHPEKENNNDQMIVTHNGKTHSTEDFRELYQLLIGLERYGIPESNPSGAVPLTVSLYDLEDNLYFSVKYYNTSGSLCTAETSEGELFTTRWGDVSFFIQQVKNYIDGKDVLLRT